MHNISNNLGVKNFLTFFSKNQVNINSNICISFDSISAQLIVKCSEISPQSCLLKPTDIKNNLYIEVYRYILEMHITELKNLQEQKNLNGDSLIKVRGIAGVKVSELHAFLSKMLDFVKNHQLLDLLNSAPYRYLGVDVQASKLLNHTLIFFDFIDDKAYSKSIFMRSKKSLIDYSVNNYDVETAIDFLCDYRNLYMNPCFFYPNNISGVERAKKKAKHDLMTGEEIAKIIKSKEHKDNKHLSSYPYDFIF